MYQLKPQIISPAYKSVIPASPPALPLRHSSPEGTEQKREKRRDLSLAVLKLSGRELRESSLSIDEKLWTRP